MNGSVSRRSPCSPDRPCLLGGALSPAQAAGSAQAPPTAARCGAPAGEPLDHGEGPGAHRRPRRPARLLRPAGHRSGRPGDGGVLRRAVRRAPSHQVGSGARVPLAGGAALQDRRPCAGLRRGRRRDLHAAEPQPGGRRRGASAPSSRSAGPARTRAGRRWASGTRARLPFRTFTVLGAPGSDDAASPGRRRRRTRGDGPPPGRPVTALLAQLMGSWLSVDGEPGPCDQA